MSYHHHLCSALHPCRRHQQSVYESLLQSLESLVEEIFVTRYRAIDIKEKKADESYYLIH